MSTQQSDPMVTVTGNLAVPLSKLKALVAEAERPQPVEGQVYRCAKCPTYPEYRKINGEWQRRDGSDEKWWNGANWDAEVCSGYLVPYTPPPPTFKVGEWVVMGDGKPFKVTKLNTSGFYGDGAIESSNGFVFTAKEIRHATPEEIAAATRIEPKKGMWLKRTKDNAIFLVISRRNHMDASAIAHRIDEPSMFYAELPPLSTEDFEVLDACPVQGVR